MIEIAGAPMRFYLAAKVLVPFFYNLKFEEILDKTHYIHEFFIAKMKEIKFEVSFENMHETISFLLYWMNEATHELFAVS